MDQTGRTLIVGVGNTLRGDDGIGVHVAQALAEESPPPVGAEVLAAGLQGVELLFAFEGADHVVLVDAAEMGQAPGEARVFDGALLGKQGEVRFSSLHGIGIAEVVALGRALGVEPRLTIVGIQPADTGPRDGLTAPLAARLPEYVALTRAQVNGSPVAA